MGAVYKLSKCQSVFEVTCLEKTYLSSHVYETHDIHMLKIMNYDHEKSITWQLLYQSE